MKSRLFYIKTVGISFLLFIESYCLLHYIYQLIRFEDLLAISMSLSVKVILLMLALIYTLSLSIGAWEKWEQYLVVVVPIVLAVFITLFISGSKYILSTTILIGLLLALEIKRSTTLKNLLIKVEPKIIMRFSAKGLLFLFSILGGVIGLIDPSIRSEFNLGDRIAEMSGKQVERYIDTQVENQILETEYDIIEQGSNVIPEGFEIPPDVEIPSTFSLDMRDIYEENKPSSEQINQFISDRVNEVTGQYEEFFQPVLSVVTFSVLQLYAVIAYLLYGLTINLVFYTAKKIKLLIVNHESVEQEILTF